MAKAKASKSEDTEGGTATAAPARRRAQTTEAAKPAKAEKPKAAAESNGKAEKPMSGTAAAVKVLRRRKNKEMSANDLLTACQEAGWKPEGKTPKQTLVAAIQNEIKRKGDKARFAKGSTPGTWKLSDAGVAG